ncbi:heavy metal translocating P-type ATPase [Paenibacillus sp. GSMTC-2017]|uniref:heavy metal translocating P-type ATPase n=1 Tax=Paenibacillus sp. GSMTC-2017 TaxID=2794350 RepID=UPI001E416458|nr:cation-translocating P-type ATPase [Paenibacillus sp. GSMTC-2017]
MSDFKFKKDLLDSTTTLNSPSSTCNDGCCSTEESFGNDDAALVSPNNENIRTYDIEGMDCSSCALTLQNHLKLHQDVTSVAVHYSSAKLHIEHSNSVEDIIGEVKKVGFHASLAGSLKGKSNSPRSSWSGIIFSAVLILFGYIATFINDNQEMTSTLLYAIAILASGITPLKSAYYALKSRSLDMNVLMSVAVIGAAILGEWLEGATVVWLFALGNVLQMKSMEKTRNSVRQLLDLAPPEAWIRKENELVRTAVERIRVGTIIIVKPGEKIPLDGIILTGESTINQAPITGESIPVDKQVGDTVYAGTLNHHGTLEVRVTKQVQDTTVSTIIRLIEEAQEKKAPTQDFVDKFARIYTPVVFIGAFVIMIFPPLLGFGTWMDWIYRGLELLVVACPCALVISTPVAIVSAIGNGAKHGILIKGGSILEKAGQLNVIAFDKTGTLTNGKPIVTTLLPIGITETELLQIITTLESYSTHPIAQAIVKHAEGADVYPMAGSSFTNEAGKGIQGTINGEVCVAGKVDWFKEMAISFSTVASQIAQLEAEGNTLILVAKNKRLIGVIAVSDTIRKTTLQTIDQLHAMGIKQTVMLTGDNEGTATKIANQAKISTYKANLLPEQKLDEIEHLQAQGNVVAMVGDGINDAPALAAAHIGIAMGGAGTDTAMETADIVLMADNLDKLPHTIKLSRKTLQIIKQNIWFSILIKLVALVLIFPNILTLWLAVLSDTGAALIVILNSMRLLKYK